MSIVPTKSSCLWMNKWSIELSGELHPHCFSRRKGIQNCGIPPERHRHKWHGLKRIPPSLSTCGTIRNLHHCPYTRYKRPAGGKEREREGEREKGSSHLAGDDLKDLALEIQSIVNIFPCRTTLKLFQSCFCTVVPTVSQRLQKEVLPPREGERSMDLWKCPDLGRFLIDVNKSQEGRVKDNTSVPFLCRTANMSRKAE